MVWLSIDSSPLHAVVTSSHPSAVLRGQKVLPLPFSAALRGPSRTKGVAVAVLRGPSWPFVDKRCCRCRSSRSFAALSGPSRPFVDKRKLQLPFFVALRGQKVLPLPFFAALRGQKVLPLPFFVARGQKVLRGHSRPFVDKRCCRCRSSRPFVALRGPFVALRGQKVLPLPFFAALRGPSWTKGVAVAVLRGPSWPFVDKRCCRCRSSWPLRGPSWTKGVAVAVLRGPSWPFVDKRCCRCRSSRPFVALRGQKVLPLPFFAALRGPSWTKGVAVAVLRGPSWPFVDKRCCRCRSSRPFVALRGQKVLPLPFFAALRGPSWTKGVAVAVLRAPPRPSVDKRCCRCRSPCPSAALRGQKVLPLPFSAPLRPPPWIKRC